MNFTKQRSEYSPCDIFPISLLIRRSVLNCQSSMFFALCSNTYRHMQVIVEQSRLVMRIWSLRYCQCICVNGNIWNTFRLCVFACLRGNFVFLFFFGNDHSITLAAAGYFDQTSCQCVGISFHWIHGNFIVVFLFSSPSFYVRFIRNSVFCFLILFLTTVTLYLILGLNVLSVCCFLVALTTADQFGLCVQLANISNVILIFLLRKGS